MMGQAENETVATDLKLPWLVVVLMFSMLVAYLMICHLVGGELQTKLPEPQRELIRTVLYVVAILTLPMTNLLRHIQLRLNQTMPGAKSAKSRYLLTVIVSMSLVESIGVFGLVMFLLGDSFNTLYIFIGMSALGMYLYRPKWVEYESIVTALAGRQ